MSDRKSWSQILGRLQNMSGEKPELVFRLEPECRLMIKAITSQPITKQTMTRATCLSLAHIEVAPLDVIGFELDRMIKALNIGMASLEGQKQNKDD